MRQRPVRCAGPALLVAMLLASPRVAYAHVGGVTGPDELWSAWGGSPLEWLLLVLPALWYAVGVRALWRTAGRGHGIAVGRAAAFGLGIVVLAVALLSPLDALADALFSAHMVQHLLLILVAAPLLVAGAPVLGLLRALPVAVRRGTGRWWARHGFVPRLVHLLTAPGVAFALHVVALWFWHFPLPYQAALASPWVHALEHLSFLGTAALFWWVVAPPMGRRRATEPARLLIVAGTLMQSGALGAVLMLARAPWYPAHALGARVWGTTLLADQQLAGLVMWVPASFVYIGAAAWVFMDWMRRDERGDRPMVPRGALPGLEGAR
jgi:putative membrane protein